MLHTLIEPRRQSCISRHNLTLQKLLKRADFPIVQDIGEAQRSAKVFLLTLSQLRVHVFEEFGDSIELRFQVDWIDTDGHPV